MALVSRNNKGYWYNEGAMQAAQQRLFIIAWTAVVIVFIGLMVMVYVSLIPHFFIIGWIAFIVLCIFLGYAVILGGAITFNQIGIWNNRRRTIVQRDVVAYLKDDGTFEHLSAQHEAAKIPRMLPAPKDEKLVMDDKTIIELYRGGNTLMQIVEAGKPVDLKYNRVQAVVAAAKKRGDVQ